MSDDTTLVKRSFWPKVRRTLGKVPFVPDAVAMYYAMLDPEVPLLAKTTIATALAYFIMPVDLIPDVLAGMGYTDDAAVILAALQVVAHQLHPRHYRQAKLALDQS